MNEKLEYRIFPMIIGGVLITPVILVTIHILASTQVGAAVVNWGLRTDKSRRALGA